MKNILPLTIILFVVIACDKTFEPELTGWKASSRPGSRIVYLQMDKRKKTIELPGNDSTSYRFPQWTKFEDRILLTQIIKTKDCYDYQLISIDTTGDIVDTIYTAPANTPINFKLAPNDSLILLKTYFDNCEDDSDNFRYSFYNRFLKRAIGDTIVVGNIRGLLIPETVWSPDSKKVIIAEWSGRLAKASTYDLTTKDTIYIDKGTNFVWSPRDNNLVAYVREQSIYTKNIETREEKLIYKGRRKKYVTDFRWSPRGDFLVVYVRGYLLNIESPMLGKSTNIYLSMPDKVESDVFFDDQRIHTWKESPMDRRASMPADADSLK